MQFERAVLLAKEFASSTKWNRILNCCNLARKKSYGNLFGLVLKLRCDEPKFLTRFFRRCVYTMWESKGTFLLEKCKNSKVFKINEKCFS